MLAEEVRVQKERGNKGSPATHQQSPRREDTLATRWNIGLHVDIHDGLTIGEALVTGWDY